MALLTNDDITQAANAVGFDAAGLTTALGMVKSIVDAGFTDPVLFTKVLMRFKLLDDKLKLQTQVAGIQTAQQQQIGKIMDDTNPDINSFNAQISQIDAQLAHLQG
jgi:hypothetical protein